MKVVLAEKPSVARDLARILGAGTRREGFLEGNGYAVTWAIGHLVGLADTRDYGYRNWDLNNLPIIPTTFQTKLIGDEGIQKQFRVIEQLFSNATEIICATDAGREGELIFRLIYQQSRCNAPFKRLWISSQTDKAIKEGFAKLKDGSAYDNLFQAARCRSESDWLVGINATQAYTLKYRNLPSFQMGAESKEPISLGRVQTPVLRMITDRWLEFKAFTPETYWELILNLEKEGRKFTAKWFNAEADRFMEEATAMAIRDKLTGNATVMVTDKKPKTEQPPLLYDLTELQKDANKRYNFSAQKTLELAQDLYEKFKTITYPRTSSRYLSDDIFPTIPGLLNTVSQVPSYKTFTNQILSKPLQQSKRFFDNTKVTDHHAIIPTETPPGSSGMGKEHYMLYDLVVRRFLCAFMEPCEKELSEIIVTDAEEQFRAKGTMIRSSGWRAVYDALEERLAASRKEEAAKKGKKKDTESGEEEEAELPYVQVGDVLPELNADIPKKKTRAPSVHTESSILALMETAGKDMEDENLREAMKDCGLGTPATRAAILETLLKRGYIVRDQKKLIPTDRGIALVELVRTKPIASPEMTGSWEMKLNQISRGEFSPDQFMREVAEYTRDIIYEVKGISRPAPLVPDYEVDLACPKCKEGRILKGRTAFGCNRYGKGCDFMLRPVVAGKMLTQEEITDLLLNGKTSRFVQGLTKRDGSRFDARLRFSSEWKVEFFFSKEP